MLIVHTTTQAQIVYLQNTFYGGVTGAGFSTGQGVGSGTFSVHIEPNSTIKNAYLICYRIGYAPSSNISLNGTIYSLDSTDIITSFFHTNPYASPASIIIKDISSFISSNDTNYFVEIPNQPNLPINWGYYTVYLYIEYENILLNRVNSLLILNNKNMTGNENYLINHINPINVLFPVGYSIYTDRTGSGFSPNINLFFNSYNLGIFGGSDNVNSNWNFSGVKGHFFYQNEQLFGLDDDTADSIITNSDGLADVSSYVNNPTACNFQLKHISYPNQPTNSTSFNLAFFLAYTTPCDTFSASVGNDTTICAGQALQLQATGGTKYEWLPQKSLSCFNCPNPIFNGDSTVVYTVRIWNNDSCSKVLPMRVLVRPAPKYQNIFSQKPHCGMANGSITATAVTGSLPPLTYTLQPGNLSNSTGIFTNLNAGTYTLSLSNGQGCTQDTTITLPGTLTVQALFAANPQQGVAPIEVFFQNQSLNALSYQWLVEGQTYSSQDLSHLFAQNGTYDVQLIATGAAAYCADTFTLQVLVYEQLTAILYNIFTPNGDGLNDAFGVTVNVPCTIEYGIFNRWGNLLHSGSTNTENAGFIPLWDGLSASDGMYFYSLAITQKYGKEQVFKGTVTLLRK